MSLLPATSHANPATPFWLSSGTTFSVPEVVDAGGNGIVQSFSATVLQLLVQKAFTAPSAGTLVINASINFGNTASSAGQYVARVEDILSGGFTQHFVSLGAGNVTAQYGTGTPLLSLALTSGQAVTLELRASASNGLASPAPTYKWDWNVVFYPA
jgi:hypothetical protein